MGEGGRRRAQGTGLGLFHMVDAEAPVAYACPCQVLRPDFLPAPHCYHLFKQ